MCHGFNGLMNVGGVRHCADVYEAREVAVVNATHGRRSAWMIAGSPTAFIAGWSRPAGSTKQPGGERAVRLDTMKRTQSPLHHLELRVREFAQLFNSMDPTPFLNKDLDRDAESFIETWAFGFPAKSRLHITIHLEKMPAELDPGALLTEAIHNFFEYKTGVVRRDLKMLLKRGRASLLIGLVFVTTCLIAAQAVSKLGSATPFAIARESLTIAGWVAMWRPMQIFLYDWWPLARRIRVYQGLRRAHVRVVAGK